MKFSEKFTKKVTKDSEKNFGEFRAILLKIQNEVSDNFARF